MNKNTKFIYFSLFFLLLSILVISSCTPIPYYYSSDYGNIQVNSVPAGASIFLDGSDTGYSSPKLLKNVPIGSYLVTFKLDGYLNSNNFTQVYPNQISYLNVQLTPNPFLPFPATRYLTHIEVEPETLTLSANDTEYIDSITAYYSDGTSQNILTNQCTYYSSDPTIATINQVGQISGISEGQTTVWINYTETGITKSDSILVSINEFNPNLGNLVSIDVLPETMNLEIGESKAISSIKAYYDSGSNQSINPEQCEFSVNNSFVSINNSGIVTGNSTGTSTVTISYTEESITKSDTISITVSENIANQSVYRALAIGIGDYIYYGSEGDLLAPPYDVNKLKEIFYDCRFGAGEIDFYRISELKDTQATKANIIQKIQSVYSGADENDISYFYFSGHGTTLNQMSYLCPTDFNGQANSAISVDELEAALSAVPGVKVVLIDSCHSGGFIGKSTDLIDEIEMNHNLTEFNEITINVFENSTLSKDLLTSNDYQVLTSSHWFQVSYELYPENSEPFGVFSQALYEGCSLNENTPADVNQDDKISLQEAYNFISQWVSSMRISQDVQIFPSNSTFTLFEY